ncbi:MAG: transpeptidase family protein [Prevotella sp.]|nr:transpeptidase family protein [Prevotella sp.]
MKRNKDNEKKEPFNSKGIMRRYVIIAILLALAIVAAVGKAGVMMTRESAEWDSIAQKLKLDSVPRAAHRGDILSANGELLASSLPVYQLIVDFDAIHNAKNDTLYPLVKDSIADGLHRIYPKYSKQYYLERLDKGFEGWVDTLGVRRWSRWYKVMPKYSDQLTYEQFQEVKQLPLFRFPSYRGGLIEKNTLLSARKKPYGSLAASVIGSFSNNQGRYGLERYFNEELAGRDGFVNRKKVLYSYLDINLQDEEDGCDIVTTIDIGIQDLAEQALLHMIDSIHAEHGCCIVMEVKTGDIKALVNLDKDTFNIDGAGHHYWNGRYIDGYNHAVSDLIEPGSVFKTVSSLVALDDGVIDTTSMVDTGGGVLKMYGSPMRDWSASKGFGFGTINLSKAMQQSSNIGISRLIDEHYKNHPEDFVKGIYRTGIHDSLGLPLKEMKRPRIRMPKRLPNGKLDQAQWHPTALPWMSIGYETQIPPISTLAFYNAIANNGKMMRPRLVKSIVKGDQVVKEYPTEVMRESICRHPEALKKVQRMLELVVEQGTAKKTAKSKRFPIAGKTGTAQIADGSKGYKSGGVVYTASFAGYFPANDPQYSCIVVVKTRTGGGAGVGGPVFKKVAEGVMAQSIVYNAKKAHTKDSQPLPDVKNGNLQSAGNVLSSIGIKRQWAAAERVSDEASPWGVVTAVGDRTMSLSPHSAAADSLVPSVIGMGARDAVYLMEKRGLKVSLSGRGRVVAQSLSPGQPFRRGHVCILELKP